MQLQPISSQFPNTISITAVRQDIDALTDLLKIYSSVKVLRGSNVLFEVKRPETEEEIKQQKLRAAMRIIQNAKNIPGSKKGMSLTKLLILERDKMRSGSYEI